MKSKKIIVALDSNNFNKTIIIYKLRLAFSTKSLPASEACEWEMHTECYCCPRYSQALLEFPFEVTAKEAIKIRYAVSISHFGWVHALFEFMLFSCSTLKKPKEMLNLRNFKLTLIQIQTLFELTTKKAMFKNSSSFEFHALVEFTFYSISYFLVVPNFLEFEQLSL